VLLGVDAAHGTARRKQRAGVVRVPRAGVRCRPSWWSARRPGQFHALLDACDFPFSFTLDPCDLASSLSAKINQPFSSIFSYNKSASASTLAAADQPNKVMLSVPVYTSFSPPNK
jgi:hypothetical protein